MRLNMGSINRDPNYVGFYTYDIHIYIYTYNVHTYKYKLIPALLVISWHMGEEVVNTNIYGF